MSKRGLISGLTLCVALLVVGCNQPNTPSSTGNSTQKSNYTNATLEEGDAAFKEKKYDIAEGIFSKFCSSGNIEACVKQGQVYTDSDSLKNTVKAFSLFKDACDKGSGRGCNQLGVHYMDDGKEATGMEYFKKSCQNGLYAGCRNTAFFYKRGTRKEIPQDIALAVEFMSKACALGHQDSCEEAERLPLNGKAKFTSKKMGTTYEGNFVNGEYHGKGKLVWKSDAIYEGDFVNGQRTGKGVITMSNGDRYEGDFVDGKITGKGKYTWKKTGNTYEGDFVDGKQTGKGTTIYSSGDIYIGDYLDGERTGLGIMKIQKSNEATIKTYNGQGYYEGSFYIVKGEFLKNNFKPKANNNEKIEKEAMRGFNLTEPWKSISKKLDTEASVSNCIVNDKDISKSYTGACVNGKAEGLGKAVGRDVYIGYFKNGNKHGNGLYIWNANNYYDGSWLYDQKEGFGHNYNHYCSQAGWLSCAGWSTDDDKGLFKNGKFVKSCGSENGCNLLVELEPKIEDLRANLKCEDANKLYSRLKAVNEGYFSYDSCVSDREYNQILNSKDTQEMYLKAVKYENNGERGRAKKVYLTIMDRFSKSPMAIKAAERLAALKDVEAVENVGRNHQSNSRQQCENNKKSCIAGCGGFISGADQHNNNMWNCKRKCEEISCY